MFNFEIQENFENVCQALDTFDETKMIPGTQYHLLKFKDEYQIGSFGRYAIYYKLEKKADRLSAKSNVWAGFTIIFTGAIELLCVLLLLKAVITMLITGNYEGAASLLVIVGLVIFFGMLTVIPVLSLKTIKRTLDSITDTSYVDM